MDQQSLFTETPPSLSQTPLHRSKIYIDRENKQLEPLIRAPIIMKPVYPRREIIPPVFHPLPPDVSLVLLSRKCSCLTLYIYSI